jgi:hypothetical protein
VTDRTIPASQNLITFTNNIRKILTATLFGAASLLFNLRVIAGRCGGPNQSGYRFRIEDDLGSAPDAYTGNTLQAQHLGASELERSL